MRGRGKVFVSQAWQGTFHTVGVPLAMARGQLRTRHQGCAYSGRYGRSVSGCALLFQLVATSGRRGVLLHRVPDLRERTGATLPSPLDSLCLRRGSVALHRHSHALVDILPPEADSTVQSYAMSEKPEVTSASRVLGRGAL